MKKSSFVALVMGTVSGVCFSLGMCMALLPEWNAFTQGIVVGAIGLILGLVTLMVWRKMEHKAPITCSRKTVQTILLAVAGALILEVGMCLCLVGQRFVTGILVGLVGILMLLCLIPLTKGLK
ncbi:MAG: hypothetical protein IJF41_07135 [Clostridia bacterium]|nr:hypothetical protein [Clostridia bacterium]